MIALESLTTQTFYRRYSIFIDEIQAIRRMAVLINLFATCCLGDSRHCSEKVSEIINNRLGTGWNNALPPPFKQTTIIFLSGESVGPFENTEYCKDLSVNWSLGDSSIEILDSTTGYAINKSVILVNLANDVLILKD